MPSPETLPFWLLGLGVAAGLFLAWRTTRAETNTAATTDLQRSDLEKQRDEIYLELRHLSDDAPGSDRQALEIRAAETLQRLEVLDAAESSSVTAAPPTPATAKKAPEAAQKGDVISRHPLAAGALLGGGMVGLVALLIFWAQGDAKPDLRAAQEAAREAAAQAQPPRGPMQGGGGGDIDRGEPPLSPQIQALVDDMRAKLQANPDDLATRKSLSQILLENQQFFQAFAEAQEILARDPEDPDGLYTAGLVRYTMGQPQEALASLDGALTSDPTYVQASLIKGMILLQIGDRESAVAAWEQGQQASGSDYRLKHLLRLAAEGKSTEEILNSPPQRP